MNIFYFHFFLYLFNLLDFRILNCLGMYVTTVSTCLKESEFVRRKLAFDFSCAHPNQRKVLCTPAKENKIRRIKCIPGKKAVDGFLHDILTLISDNFSDCKLILPEVDSTLIRNHEQKLKKKKKVTLGRN